MQAPCDKGGLVRGMIVGQPAAMESGHEKKVGIWLRESHESQEADCQSAAG